MKLGDRSNFVHAAQFRGISTEAAPAKERFDFWHELFPHIDMRRTTEDGLYSAGAQSCLGDDGAAFTDLVCAPTASRFYDGRSDHMQLCLVQQGSFGFIQGKDERLWLEAGGGLLLHDTHRRAETYSEQSYRAVHVTLPRAAVYRAMGGNPIKGPAALRALPATPLGHLLIDQLAALSRHGPKMNGEEAAAAMRLLSGLALTYLDSLDPHHEQDEHGDALFASACHFIETHVESQALTSETISRAIGCSRATLYRMFEWRGLTVAEEIRNCRLNHSRSLLRDHSLDIGEVAIRSGYGDLSAFGRAFKRRFGMSPGEWRHEAALQD